MLYKIIFLFLIALFFSSCASIVPPTGGEGDKTPPIIKNASIKQAQTNFSDNKITLEFSKYMNRGSVNESIIISPTVRYSHKWNAKKITINFPDALRENTTYSVQLGGTFSDILGNAAQEAYFIYFSTGDMIDTGKIEGKIITEKPEGYYIFCYIIDDFNAENLDDNTVGDISDNSSIDEIKIDYLTKIPDYKVQIGTTGNFTVPALKDGKYRVIAVKDVDKDGLVTQIKDTVGVPVFDPIVNANNNNFVKIIPSQIVDIISPEIINLSAATQNEVAITFSERIILDSFDINSIYLTQRDDTTNRWYPAAFTVDNPNEIKEIKLFFSESLKSAQIYNINLDSAKNHTIKDANNNPLLLPIKKNLIVSTDSVPQALTVKTYPITDAAKDINIVPNFVLTFSNPIIFSDDLASKIKLFKDSKEIELNFSQPFSNQIIFTPKQILEENKMYRFEINCSDLRDIWDSVLVDSLKVLNFETGKQKVFSHFNGKVIIASKKCNYTHYLKITQKSEQGKPIEYTTKIREDNTFSFPKVLPGTYTIMYFCDINENGKYDYGSLFPFEFAEPFILIEQTITIRERWSVDDYTVEIK